MIRRAGDQNESQRAVALMTGHAAVLLFVVSIARDLIVTQEWGFLVMGALEGLLAGGGMLNSYMALSHAGSKDSDGQLKFRKWEDSSLQILGTTIATATLGTAAFAAADLLGWGSFPGTK